MSNKRKLKKPTKEVRLVRFREQERNRLAKDAAPPPLPKFGVMAGGVVDPDYLELVARAQARAAGVKYLTYRWGDWERGDIPLEQGTYEQVVTDAKRYAERLNRTILVGDIASGTGFPDSSDQFHMLEIELLCPHGNGTDELVYVKEGGGEPFKEPQDGLWEHSETGTVAMMLDCPCPGVT